MTHFEWTWERERQGDKLYSLWTRTQSPLLSSDLSSLLSSNWVTWYKGEKVIKDAKSIFQRRFHWRRRCRIVRSLFPRCRWKRECIKGNRRRQHAAYPADSWNEKVFPLFLSGRHKFLFPVVLWPLKTSFLDIFFRPFLNPRTLLHILVKGRTQTEESQYTQGNYTLSILFLLKTICKILNLNERNIPSSLKVLSH